MPHSSLLWTTLLLIHAIFAVQAQEPRYEACRIGRIIGVQCPDFQRARVVISNSVTHTRYWENMKAMLMKLTEPDIKRLEVSFMQESNDGTCNNGQCPLPSNAKDKWKEQLDGILPSHNAKKSWKNLLGGAKTYVGGEGAITTLVFMTLDEAYTSNSEVVVQGFDAVRNHVRCILLSDPSSTEPDDLKMTIAGQMLNDCADHTVVEVTNLQNTMNDVHMCQYFDAAVVFAESCWYNETTCSAGTDSRTMCMWSKDDNKCMKSGCVEQCNQDTCSKGADAQCTWNQGVCTRKCCSGTCPYNSCKAWSTPSPTTSPPYQWGFRMVRERARCNGRSLQTRQGETTENDCAVQCKEKPGCEYFYLESNLCDLQQTSLDCKVDGFTAASGNFYRMEFGLTSNYEVDEGPVSTTVAVIIAGVSICTLLFVVYCWCTRQPQKYPTDIANTTPMLGDESMLPGDPLPWTDLRNPVEIGRGSFGRVFKALFKGTDELVAVKELQKKSNKSGKTKKEEFIKEIVALNDLRHNTILNFYGWSKDDKGNLYMVTEYCPHGSLLSYAKSKNVEFRANIALELVSVARALAYIHNRSKVHMDVAARNVLRSTSDFKLADVGLLTDKGKPARVICIPWSPPEVLRAPQSKRVATQEHDVWSFGCLLYEVLECAPPYWHISAEAKALSRDKVAAEIINEKLPTIPKIVEEGNDPLATKIWTDVVLPCWNIDPRKRPNIQEVASQLQLIERQHIALSTTEAVIRSQGTPVFDMYNTDNIYGLPSFYNGGMDYEEAVETAHQVMRDHTMYARIMDSGVIVPDKYKWHYDSGSEFEMEDVTLTLE